MYNSGLNYANWVVSSKAGVPIKNRQLYESMRVVAGGFRLYKTSSAETESGVIKVFYA